MHKMCFATSSNAKRTISRDALKKSEVTTSLPLRKREKDGISFTAGNSR